MGQEISIQTKDGNDIIGTMTSIDDEYLYLETQYGQVKVLREQVKAIEQVNLPKSGDRKDNAYSGSHYFLAQSAFNLEEGQFLYENFNILFNSFGYGLTDNFNVYAGFEIISPLFSEFPVTYFTPKFSMPFNKGALSISSTLFIVPFEDYSTFGFLQGALTLGTLKDNFTIGTGIGYSFQDGFEDALIPVTASAMFGITNTLSVITENWILIGDGFTEGVISLGLRVHSKRNNSLSLGLWRVTEDTGPFLAWPTVSGTIAIK